MVSTLTQTTQKKLQYALGNQAAATEIANLLNEAVAGTTGLVNTNITTAIGGVLTAAGMVGGLITRSGPTAAYSDATATASALWSAQSSQIANEFILAIKNTVAFPQTLTGGTGVTLSGQTVIPPLSVGRFLVSLASSSAATMRGIDISSMTTLASTLDNTVTTGTGTMVSGAMEGAQFVTLTASGQAAITLTTRTAAQIQANVPNFQVGQTYRLRIVNNNTGTLTTAGGSNVTMTSTIPANNYADYTVTFATATTITVAQINVAPTVVLPATKFVTINVTTGTLAAGNASGAAMVDLTSTNATPGSQAMRTPAQVLSDSQAAGLAIGSSYVLRIKNTGAGTFTLATDSGTGFTMTGTMTILTNSFREFVVTLSTATTGVVQDVGSPSDLVPALGVAAGYKIARGVHQQAAASDTVATGLTTVVAVCVSWRDAPTVKQLFINASIGDQAGTPAAGSVLIRTYKPTAVNDVTPTAATDFTDNLSSNWVAIGV